HTHLSSYCSSRLLHLHSFPTRRSSDLLVSLYAFHHFRFFRPFQPNLTRCSPNSPPSNLASPSASPITTTSSPTPSKPSPPVSTRSPEHTSQLEPRRAVVCLAWLVKQIP